MHKSLPAGFAAHRFVLPIVLLFIALEISPVSAQTTPLVGISPLPKPSLAPVAGGDGPAESVPGVPSLNSRLGAPYTVYLDFGGFSFSGNWDNNASYTPGVTPAYDVDGNATAFSSTEQANIKNIWSRVSEKYAPFNVNVTTVDPAVAAGAAGTDLLRQNYYDSQPRMMHTVIGGSGTWIGGGGVSFVNVTPFAETGSNGLHTNWVFSAEAPSNLQFVGEASAHENGHGFGLWHQDDYTGGTYVNEYSSGNSTVAPIMGNSYSTQRGLWSVGTSHVGSSTGSPFTQNDVQTIANDPSMNGFLDDGIGHSRATATPLPVSSSSIDFTSAKGDITPLSASSPTPTGSSNYTEDWWSFTTTGGAVTIHANSGRSTITAGTPDPGATLDAILDIYDSTGLLLSQINTTSLSETYSATLPAGNYFAQVIPTANATDSSFTTRLFFDEGDYFLSGTIPLVVPEPSALTLTVLAAIALIAGRRRPSPKPQPINA